MTQPVVVQRVVLEETLRELAKRGWHRTERVALWLAQRREDSITVQEVYVPQYEASCDYFHIPRASMATLMEHLRDKRLMIGAQLHTHPLEAFHSAADDRWAIVRHAGALSIVIPHFGRFATAENFLDHAKVFRLNPGNEWVEVARSELRHLLGVV